MVMPIRNEMPARFALDMVGAKRLISHATQKWGHQIESKQGLFEPPDSYAIIVPADQRAKFLAGFGAIVPG